MIPDIDIRAESKETDFTLTTSWLLRGRGGRMELGIHLHFPSTLLMVLFAGVRRVLLCLEFPEAS